MLLLLLLFFVTSSLVSGCVFQKPAGVEAQTTAIPGDHVLRDVQIGLSQVRRTLHTGMENQLGRVISAGIYQSCTVVTETPKTTHGQPNEE